MVVIPPYPLVDNRTPEEIIEQIKKLARSYLPDAWIAGNYYSVNNSLKPDTQNWVNPNKDQQQYLDNYNSFDDPSLDLVIDDLGISISKVFADIYCNVIERLNKLPQKNFISFLNTLGFELSSPIPSKVPVTFKVTEKATNDVFVPAGTKVSAEPNDQREKELVFETLENMLASKASIEGVFSVDTKRDAIYGHLESIQANEKFNFFFDQKNGNVQQHILYLGHDELFNFKKTRVKIEITVFPYIRLDNDRSNDHSLIELLADNDLVVWEYGWEYDKKGKEIKNSASQFEFQLLKDTATVTNNNNSEKTIILSNLNATKTKNNKVKVNGIEKYWMRCKVISDTFFTKLGKIDLDLLPDIQKMFVKVDIDKKNDNNLSDADDSQRGSDSDNDGNNGKNEPCNHIERNPMKFVRPDQLFYKDVPLNIPSDESPYSNNDLKGSDAKGPKKPDLIYPFGVIPLTYDVFYIGSNDCFSKKGADIQIDFCTVDGAHSLYYYPVTDDPDDDNKINTETDNRNDHKIRMPHLSWEYWDGKGWNLLKVDIHDNCIRNSDGDGENNNNKNKNSNNKICMVKFECPIDIVSTKVNGFENYWIRVRIASGNYGNIQMKVTKNGNDETIKLDSSKIKYPAFSDIKITFEYDISQVTDGSQPQPLPDQGTQDMDSDKLKTISPFCMTFNNLDYQIHSDVDNNKIIIPFVPFTKFIDNSINNIVKNIGGNLNLQSRKSFKSTSDNNDSILSTADISMHPSCLIYLGFNGKLENGPYHVYLSIIEKQELPEYIKRDLNFYYFSEKGWKKLFVIDNTNYFTKKGTINFYVPPDFKRSKLFGNELFWIKIEDTDNLFQENFHLLPNIDGLHLNTTLCVNSSLVEDELLHRDESNLDILKFVFSNKPVISSVAMLPIRIEGAGQGDGEEEDEEEQVWIKEDLQISRQDRKILLKNKRLLEINDTLKSTVETWVRWVELKDSSLKTFAGDQKYLEKYSRRYNVDRINGILTLEPIFESNLQNIPYANSNVLTLSGKMDVTNIKDVKATYRTGGGSFGNVHNGEIKKLKSLVPSIDSVINIAGGEGGSDSQSVENAMLKWPHVIMSKSQAVTVEDYENLVENQFMSVLRAKCFPTTDSNGQFKPGHILVIVIPKLEDKNKQMDIDDVLKKDSGGGPSKMVSKNKAPYPSIGLLENIKRYLESISSSIVTFSSNLHIRGPKYYGVFVSAQIYIKDINRILEIREKSLASLTRFLDPTIGGDDGQGWNLGKILNPSDVIRLFFEIKGISHVGKVVIKIHPDEIDDHNKEIVYLFNQRLDIDIIKSKKESRTTSPLSLKNKKNVSYQEKNKSDKNKSSNFNSGMKEEDVVPNQFELPEEIESFDNFNENSIPKHGMIYDAGSHNLEISIIDDSTLD